MPNRLMREWEGMSERERKSIRLLVYERVIRDIHEAINKGDLEKALSFFADDATMITCEGTFTGKAEIRRRFTWFVQQWSDLKVIEKDLILGEDRVAHEYVIEGTTPHGKEHLPGAAIYVFGNGKVQQVHDYHDRLTLARQLSRGWLARRTVSSIIERMEKGLHPSAAPFPHRLRLTRDYTSKPSTPK